MKLIKIFKQEWQCENCGKKNILNKRISKDFQYCIKHICTCGTMKVLVNDKFEFVS